MWQPLPTTFKKKLQKEGTFSFYAFYILSSEFRLNHTQMSNTRFLWKNRTSKSRARDAIVSPPKRKQSIFLNPGRVPADPKSYYILQTDFGVQLNNRCHNSSANIWSENHVHKLCEDMHHPQPSHFLYTLHTTPSCAHGPCSTSAWSHPPQPQWSATVQRH